MPSSYHPTAQQWSPWVRSNSAPRKHLTQDYKQITVTGQNDKALVCYINSYTPSISRALPHSPSSADPVFTELAVWPTPLSFQRHISPLFENMPGPVYVILWHKNGHYYCNSGGSLALL